MYCTQRGVHTTHTYRTYTLTSICGKWCMLQPTSAWYRNELLAKLLVFPPPVSNTLYSSRAVVRGSTGMLHWTCKSTRVSLQTPVTVKFCTGPGGRTIYRIGKNTVNDAVNWTNRSLCCEAWKLLPGRYLARHTLPGAFNRILSGSVDSRSLTALSTVFMAIWEWKGILASFNSTGTWACMHTCATHSYVDTVTLRSALQGFLGHCDLKLWTTVPSQL